ncbi:MAG: DnaJ domain-containing protein [Actinobacteria bacterium]|nr:DnaJ domain-containing protein [Actinomycetota bacterium]
MDEKAKTKKLSKAKALQLLGLSGNPDEAEIKEAFKKATLTINQDKSSGNGDMENRFKEIGEAYDLLINKLKKISTVTAKTAKEQN